jgi:hypothetical protein
MSNRITFLVSMDIPSGAKPLELMDYVLTEVMAGCGARDPHDPIFHLDRDSVTVTLHRQPKKSGPQP